MIYGDVNICHAVVDENGYIKYIGTRCHERRKGYATNLINELKLEFTIEAKKFDEGMKKVYEKGGLGDVKIKKVLFVFPLYFVPHSKYYIVML